MENAPWEKYQQESKDSSGQQGNKGPWSKYASTNPTPDVTNESWGHWAGRQAIDTLPTAGLVTGGMIGTPGDVLTGPMGTIAGGALGYAAGRQLQRLGHQYILGDNDDNSATQPLDVAKQTGTDLLNGATGTMAGQIGGKLLSPVGKYLAEKYGAAVPASAESATQQGSRLTRGRWPGFPPAPNAPLLEAAEESAPAATQAAAPVLSSASKHPIARAMGAAMGAGLGHMTHIPGASVAGGFAGAELGGAMGKYGSQLASTGADAASQAISTPMASEVGGYLANQIPKSVLMQQQTQQDTAQAKSQLAKNAMRPESVIPKLAANPATAHYAKSLQDAAAKGQDNFAARYYLLSQQYPDFRAATNEGKE